MCFFGARIENIADFIARDLLQNSRSFLDSARSFPRPLSHRHKTRMSSTLLLRSELSGFRDILKIRDLLLAREERVQFLANDFPLRLNGSHPEKRLGIKMSYLRHGRTLFFRGDQRALSFYFALPPRQNDATPVVRPQSAIARRESRSDSYRRAEVDLAWVVTLTTGQGNNRGDSGQRAG